jgi:carbon-monoxide dehydrogenase medium subunit
MFPARFDYHAATSLDEAVGILAADPETTKVLSGGQSLVPLLKLRLVQPDLVLDINNVPGLDRITEVGDFVVVGALVRHHQFASDPVIARQLPWLHDIVPLIADRQVRSLGTLAGTLVEADPTGDWSAAMLALDALVDVVGPTGRRTIASRDWFTYAFTPALSDDEIVEQVRIPKQPRPAVGAYAKLEKRAGDFAVAGVAVTLDLDEAGVCGAVGVGLTGVGSTPMLASAAAAILRGSRVDDATVAAAEQAVTEAVNPMEDMRGSAEYKREMAGVMFRRAVATALSRRDEEA